MSYFVCIPSFRRSQICNNRTLKTLEALGISASKIYVFIVDEEKEAYEKDLNPELYYKLIIGVKGLVAQRNFISAYFPEGTHILSLDDDIESLDLSLTEFQSADEFILKGFDTCIEENAFIWGIYPVFNSFFRKKTKPITTHLNYIVGAFFGFINRYDADLELKLCLNGQKEDVERSILYFLKDKKVVRFNQVGFKTKYFGRDGGGLGTFKDRLQPMSEASKLLNDAYSEITRIKIRKNQMTEIVLRSPPKRQKKIKLIEVPQEEIDEPIWLPEYLDTNSLFDMLTKIKVPNQKNGRGRSGTFGEHRSMTFGFIKARVSRKFELSYNSKRLPEIYEEILRIGKLICPFDFNAIHLNHNVVCPRHKDANNSGSSVIISFGDYVGGSLFIENQGEFVTKNRPLLFDGSKMFHWNEPITSGNKYSLIFFTSKNI